MNREKSIAFIEKHGVEPFVNSFVPSLFADVNHKDIPKLLERAKTTPKSTVLIYTQAMMHRSEHTQLLKTRELVNVFQNYLTKLKIRC